MNLITQEMCNEAVKKFLRSLIYVPDCYVRLQEMRYEDYSQVVIPVYWLDDGKLFHWGNSYKQLSYVGWHSSRWWDWWDEKKEGRCGMMMSKVFRQLGDYQIVVLAI